MDAIASPTHLDSPRFHLQIGRGGIFAALFAASILVILLIAMLRPGMPHAAVAPAGQSMSILWLAPFTLLLAAIAIMPFLNKHGGEKYSPAVSLALAAIAAGGYCLILTRPEKWLHGMADY